VKFYRLIITGDKVNFGGIFETLQTIGKFIMESKDIIFETSMSIEDIWSNFISKGNTEADIIIYEVSNIEQDIRGLFILDWIKRDQFIERSKPVQEEYQNRLQAMDSIISDAINIAQKSKEGGELSKWQQIKKKLRPKKNQS
jgi:hypothetical protein